MEGLDAEQVAERAMKIAAEICVYTNDNFVKEVRWFVFFGGGVCVFVWGVCVCGGGSLCVCTLD